MIPMLQILFSAASIVVNVALLVHGELEKRRQFEAMDTKREELMRTSLGLLQNEAREEALALAESPERVAATNGVRGYR